MYSEVYIPLQTTFSAPPEPRVGEDLQTAFSGRLLRCGVNKCPEVWCTEAGDRIPACLCREASCVATNGRALRDVCKCCISLLVKPRVEEAKRWFARGKKSVVYQSDDRGERWGGGGGATHGGDLAIPNDDVVVTLGSDIWITTPSLVVQTIVSTVQTVDVCFDGCLLVIRGIEIVGKASARAEPRTVEKSVYANNLADTEFRAELTQQPLG